MTALGTVCWSNHPKCLLKLVPSRSKITMLRHRVVQVRDGLALSSSDLSYIKAVCDRCGRFAREVRGGSAAIERMNLNDAALEFVPATAAAE